MEAAPPGAAEAAQPPAPRPRPRPDTLPRRTSRSTPRRRARAEPSCSLPSTHRAQPRPAWPTAQKPTTQRRDPTGRGFHARPALRSSRTPEARVRSSSRFVLLELQCRRYLPPLMAINGIHARRLSLSPRRLSLPVLSIKARSRHGALPPQPSLLPQVLPRPSHSRPALWTMPDRLAGTSPVSTPP